MWLGGGRRVLLCRCRLRGSSCFLERLVLPWLCGIGGVGGWVGGWVSALCGAMGAMGELELVRF